MNAKREAQLEAKGWKSGTVQDFLQLTTEGSASTEIKLALSRELKKRREAKMTQRELAEKLRSSQPRIVHAQFGDGSVSTDMLVRALLATDASPKDIGRVIAACSPSLNLKSRGARANAVPQVP